MGGYSAADESGSKEGGNRNIEWLCEEDNEEKAESKDDVEFPSLQSIEGAPFNAENEDTKRDNNEVGTEEVDEENRYVSRVDEALEGSKFAAALTALKVNRK
jgi:hypothetical protein